MQIYHFERRFHARRFRGWDVGAMIQQGIPKESMERLSRGEQLDEAAKRSPAYRAPGV